MLITLPLSFTFSHKCLIYIPKFFFKAFALTSPAITFLMHTATTGKTNQMYDRLRAWYFISFAGQSISTHRSESIRHTRQSLCSLYFCLFVAWTTLSHHLHRKVFTYTLSYARHEHFFSIHCPVPKPPSLVYS
jgi:hypothetical protein